MLPVQCSLLQSNDPTTYSSWIGWSKSRRHLVIHERMINSIKCMDQPSSRSEAPNVWLSLNNGTTYVDMNKISSAGWCRIYLKSFITDLIQGMKYSTFVKTVGLGGLLRHPPELTTPVLTTPWTDQRLFKSLHIRGPPLSPCRNKMAVKKESHTMSNVHAHSVVMRGGHYWSNLWVGILWAGLKYCGARTLFAFMILYNHHKLLWATLCLFFSGCERRW